MAGNQGFLAIGDWIDSYTEQLQQLFNVHRLPSYSTIRRVLLKIDYEDYGCKLAAFFQIAPLEGETIGLDGKVLRGSFMVESTNPDCQQQFVPHQSVCTVNKGHGRIEKRTVSICPFNFRHTSWNSISTAIRVESQRITRERQETETRYYISDLTEDAASFARRIRGYWGVENQVP